MAATAREPLDHDDLLKISTDGSSIGNGKAEAAAGVGVFFGVSDPRNIGRPLGLGPQTNQRAELSAILDALTAAPLTMNVLIRTDSKYCKNIVEKWYDTWEYRSWLKPKGIEHLNMDLIERIMDLKKRRSRRDAMTEFFWVKGHAGDPGNEAADKLAEAGARRAYWEKHGRWPIGDRSLPQNRPGDVDFVLGKKVVRRRDGKGEDLVPLTPEELEAQLAALRGWKAKREPVGDGRVGQDKVSKKKAKKKTRQNGK